MQHASNLAQTKQQVSSQQSTHSTSSNDSSRATHPHRFQQQHPRDSPLHFTCKINGVYYISFVKRHLWSIVIKCLVLAVFNYFLVQFFTGLDTLVPLLRDCIKYGLYSQTVFHALLCFVDPGTILQDQQDTYDEERTYCTTCGIYRYRSSRHCMYCGKCVRKYDHHCGVFQKCIGGRNLVLFYIVLILTSLEGPTLIMSLLFHTFDQSS